MPESFLERSGPKGGRIPSWRVLGDAWRTLPPLIRGGLILMAGGLVLLCGAWYRCGLQGCPNIDRLTAYQPGRAPQLLDREGRAFADLAPAEGEVVKLRSLPAHVPLAFLAVEDQRFYRHRGVDWRRVVGAMLANLRAGGYGEGFSTLSMQLARNVFPDRIRAGERTPSRKLLEIRVALEIEDKFSKDEILELYLNQIYFGNGARGIEAAARHYFRVPARSLSLSQAALLAALPKGPTLYDPRRHPQRARERRDLVLTLMERQARIKPSLAAAARETSLAVVRKSRPPRTDEGLASYFVEQVRRELEERMGENLYDEPLRIRTTLDLDAQRAAEQELARQLQAVEGGALGPFRGPRYAPASPTTDGRTHYLQGAVVVLEVATGDVLAWVGGRDFLHSRFDRVRLGMRQAGSAFKPFVYAAALASGRTLSQHLLDEPLRVSLDRRRWWEPKNFDGTFEGDVTVREALVRSKNVPTVRLADDVGLDDIADLANDAGIQASIPETPSMPLGTVALSALELATAYTVFASLGERVAPRLVLRVERPNGEKVWEAGEPGRRRVLDPGVAFLVTDVLREALVRGTGTAVRESGFQGPAAGKTGTTNDGTDAWFVGYTPELLGAVWMGFDQPRPIVPLATGGRLAAPVWARLMLRIYRDRPLPPPWTAPSGVIEAWVDPATGSPLAEGCRPLGWPVHRELFLSRTMPRSVCPEQGEPLTVVADLPMPSPDDEEVADLSLGLPDLPEGRSQPPPPAELEEVERYVEELLKNRRRYRSSLDELRRRYGGGEGDQRRRERRGRRERDEDDD